jgi:microsomal dipeptidase-like Zn-dependent dipeptidase
LQRRWCRCHTIFHSILWSTKSRLWMDEERREEDRKRETYLFCSVRGWVHALQHFSHQQRVYKTAILLKRRKKTTRRHTHTDIVIHIQTRKKEEGRERVESKKKRFFSSYYCCICCAWEIVIVIVDMIFSFT